MPFFAEVDIFWQLGVGGAIVVFIIRELFIYLKNKNDEPEGTSGGQSIEFWRSEIEHSVEKALAPFVREEIRILHDIQMSLQELVILTRQQSERSK